MLRSSTGPTATNRCLMTGSGVDAQHGDGRGKQMSALLLALSSDVALQRVQIAMVCDRDLVSADCFSTEGRA
jgi:hypothetical protein